MAVFRYEAIDAAGKAASGVIESDSAQQARGALRNRGLLPVAVESTASIAPAKDARVSVLRQGLGSFQLVLITRQFSTLLSAGLTVEHTLAALIEQSASESERETLASVRSEVLAGRGLAPAFSMAGFPEIYCGLVGAGERSGRLAAVMEKLADYLERRQDTRARLMQALIYPAVVGLIAVAVVVALLVYVVPQLVTVFESARTTLPWPTRALIGVSALVRATWWVFIVLGALVAATISWAMRKPAYRARAHALMLRLPLIGNMLRLADSARFSAALAILTGGGVPILAALESSASTVKMVPLRRAIDVASAAVQEGVSLSKALLATNEFPPLLIHLIANGELTGGIETALDAAARASELELNARTGVAMALIEPALIVIMGLAVLAIVLAVLMPVIEINQLLGTR
jgi:general secretion pathway protein F